jgi:uncharacterized membrane protein
MKKLGNYFLQGLLYIAPLGLTGYIIFVSFTFIDGILKEYLFKFGLGVLTLILFLMLIGFVGKTIIAKPIKLIFNKIIRNIPLLNFVYSALSDLFSAFVGKEKKFNQPVLVRVNLNSDLEKMGFITREDMVFLNEKSKVAVYFPHSYNFSGELFIVPRDNVTLLKINASEAMKFIVSAGLSGLDGNGK